MINLSLLDRKLFDHPEVDVDDMDKDKATHFIANRIAAYNQDFEDWTPDAFKAASKNILKDLKTFPGSRGSVNLQQEAFNTSRSSKDVRATPDFDSPTAPPPQAMIYQNQQLHPQQPVIPHVDPYNAVPPLPIPNERVDTNSLEKFIKLWDKSPKFDGKEYNLLDSKIYMMYSICRMNSVSPGQFHAVLLYILDEIARDHSSRTVRPNTNFLQAYNLLK
ncbi:hypothetical protein GcC1_207049 [Golovinomyces cichoracearum]|uniref:Uncharacterized protein n=1 Tax=Golovinomyces cichoracearum TaxID=62708 RepID=A0A420HBV3_9PEZI|nr:hypothetical protein GcC1_207049 [Golovinomyces cichoracearum]